MNRTYFISAIGLLGGFTSLLVAQDMPLSQVITEGESWEPVVTGYNFTDALESDA